ncbi:MAG TPA: universal stress protein [Actinomycetes bacterium]|nr:universal stress protein [Actinomycetes bacterium]
MGTIVVGYVPSPEGEAALDRAVDEARLRGSSLVVVNSQRGGRTADYEELALTDEQVQAIHDRLHAAGIEHDVRGLVRGKDPADDLIAVAEETSAELIVIGLRKRSPVGKLIMGSNAQRILLDAECPVLAVKRS